MPNPSTTAHRARAAALPPEERRATIVAATIPLLLAKGSGVTTRELAEAAGIAEGTLFRVFPDKDSLIEAAVDQALDPAPTNEAIAAIDLTLPLEARLTAAVAIMQHRVVAIWQLLTAVGKTKPHSPHSSRPRPNSPDLTPIGALFEPDADRLRQTPMEAAQLLRSLTFAATVPQLCEEPLDPAQVVSLLLDGIRHHPMDPSC